MVKLPPKGITGTDIGAICHVNKNRSAMSIYLDKIGCKEKQPDNEAMYWGRQHEDMVAKERLKNKINLTNNMRGHNK